LHKLSLTLSCTVYHKCLMNFYLMYINISCISQTQQGFFMFFYYLGINKQQPTTAYNNEQQSPQDYVSNNRILKPIYHVILRQHCSLIVSISIFTEYDLYYTVCIYRQHVSRAINWHQYTINVIVGSNHRTLEIRA